MNFQSFGTKRHICDECGTVSERTPGYRIAQSALDPRSIFKITFFPHRHLGRRQDVQQQVRLDKLLRPQLTGTR